MKLLTTALFLCIVMSSVFAQKDTLKTEDKKEEIQFDEHGQRIFDDVKERKGIKYRFIPLPSYEPSTKWGINIINVLTYYPSKGDLVSPPSSSAIFGNITTNGSMLGGINQRLFLNEDTWRLTGMALFGKINQNMTLSENPIAEDPVYENARISSNMTYISVMAERKVYDRLYAGVGYIYSGRRMEGRDDRSTELLQANSFSEATEGFSGLKYVATWDNRDNINYPYKGVRALVSMEQMLGDNAPNIYYADYRQFFTLGNNVSNILAIHGTGRFISSDAPRSFWSNYGRSGANVQRGYEVGKYMDRNLISMEAEYRKETPWLNHKLGFIGAVGMGKVFGDGNDANNLSNKFKDAPWLPTVAIGARYRVMAYERLNVKVDYAVGKDGGVVYFGITEAF
ncbi:BamA/TamA family outer membrane protein [Carboxylicivirga linearis]|uniref:BamA/TamA family outer membrane protein n=1 Tax=Carboxylicivirga linearis TaxID=1628157 RepID=A0ABS5K062_9BACT|nr:BamA/TamA family outer membrane protein [Carboxylicivirga linearis]MBS2100557.1 BamA/TamA family outer membrane protein [Carboxylicivirga linearis]